MKSMIQLTRPAFLALLLICSACEEEEKKPEHSCYTCTGCQGQYGQLLNGEYCTDGFDNRQDWEAMKAVRENEDGCKCEYN